MAVQCISLFLRVGWLKPNSLKVYWVGGVAYKKGASYKSEYGTWKLLTYAYCWSRRFLFHWRRISIALGFLFSIAVDFLITVIFGFHFTVVFRFHFSFLGSLEIKCFADLVHSSFGGKLYLFFRRLILFQFSVFFPGVQCFKSSSLFNTGARLSCNCLDKWRIIVWNNISMSETLYIPCKLSLFSDCKSMSCVQRRHNIHVEFTCPENHFKYTALTTASFCSESVTHEHGSKNYLSNKVKRNERKIFKQKICNVKAKEITKCRTIAEM